MVTQALVLAGGSDCRDWLQSCLGDALVVLPADAVDTRQGVAEVAQTPDVSLVFVGFDGESLSGGASMVAALAAAYPSLPVVAVGHSDAGDQVLSAMRAGAEDYFVIGRDDSRVSELLERVMSRKRKPNDSGTRAAGRIVTVVSAGQSALLAFLAGHIAFVLQSRREGNERVLFVDLSLPGGNAIIMFDGAHDYTALDILNDVERCDETLVESAFQKLDNGVYLLGLPEDFVGARLDGQLGQLGRLLEILRGLFDHVVIAADRGLGVHNVATLMAHSEHNLMLSDQSVLRSRQNKALLSQLRQADAPLHALGLVIANYRSDIGMEPLQLAELLGVPLSATLAGRSTNRMKAMNTGESMLDFAPSDGFTRGVQTLASQVLGIQPPARKRSSPWRLFGRGKD